MSGFSTQTTDHLIRSDIWSGDMKELFEEELSAQKFVHMLGEFGDGDTLHIPSLGQAQVLDFEEGEAVKYSSFATGDFTFSINRYKQSGTYITDKMKQDSYYANQLTSSFVPKMHRALATNMETDVLAIGVNGQVKNNANVINGADHRLIASGTNSVITPEDFARARYALRKAYVPMTNLVAIVDPSVEFNLSTQANLVNLSNNRSWEGIVRDGATTGTRFLFNIFGFDVYTSDFLPKDLTETIGGKSVTGDGVANLFFSASGGDASPFVGAVRQAPRVESERNKDLQRDEFIVTARYGYGFYRPENFVAIISDVSAAVAP